MGANEEQGEFKNALGTVQSPRNALSHHCRALLVGAQGAISGVAKVFAARPAVFLLSVLCFVCFFERVSARTVQTQQHAHAQRHARRVRRCCAAGRQAGKYNMQQRPTNAASRAPHSTPPASARTRTYTHAHAHTPVAVGGADVGVPRLCGALPRRPVDFCGVVDQQEKSQVKGGINQGERRRRGSESRVCLGRDAVRVRCRNNGCTAESSSSSSSSSSPRAPLLPLLTHRGIGSGGQASGNES